MRRVTGPRTRGSCSTRIYQPQGTSLPRQVELELDYKHGRGERDGIVFNRLVTLANMPIQRLGAILLAQGQFDDAHLDRNLDAVTCCNLISIDYRGFVYDCDFKQMLDLPLSRAKGRRVHLSELRDDDVTDNPIHVAGHCCGCSADQGSSRGGR